MSRIVLKETRFSESTTRGKRKIQQYEGPAEDLAAFLATELPAGWIEKDTVYTDGSQWVRVDTSYPDSTDVPPGDEGLLHRQWERDFTYEERSIVLCPNAQSLAATTSMDPVVRRSFAQWPQAILMGAQKYFRVLQRYLDQENSGETQKPEPSTFYPLEAEPASATPTQRGVASEMFEVCLKLQDPVHRVGYPVLRKTETVVAATVLKVSSLYTNKFISRSTLAATEPTMPIAPLIDWAGLTGYVWLKMEPVVSIATGGLWQLTQEYHGALEYEQFMYGPLIDL